MGAFSQLAWSMARANYGRLELPYKLTLIVTYNCNLRCKMCNIWQRHPVNEFTLEEYDRFFSMPNRFSWVNVSGGEIFLRRDLPDLFEIILDRCQNLYLLDFPTAGLMTDRVVTTIECVLKKDPRKVLTTISLDGPPEVHEEVRGIPGAFAKATETYRQLKRLRRKNFDVFCGMTLSRYNHDQLDATVQALQDVIPGFTRKDLHVNIAHKSSHYYGNDDQAVGDSKSIDATLGRLLHEKGRWHPVQWLERRYLQLSHVYLNTARAPQMCEALSSSCFVDPHGQVYPCSIWDAPVGRLREADYDLRTIWQAEEALRRRAEIETGQCPQCWTPCEAYQTIVAHVLPGHKSSAYQTNGRPRNGRVSDPKEQLS